MINPGQWRPSTVFRMGFSQLETPPAGHDGDSWRRGGRGGGQDPIVWFVCFQSFSYCVRMFSYTSYVVFLGVTQNVHFPCSRDSCHVALPKTVDSWEWPCSHCRAMLQPWYINYRRSFFLEAAGDATPAASASSRPKGGGDAVGSAHEALVFLFSLHNMFFSGSQCHYRAPAWSGNSIHLNPSCSTWLCFQVSWNSICKPDSNWTKYKYNDMIQSV